MARISDAVMLSALRQASLGSVMIEGFSYHLLDHLVGLRLVSWVGDARQLTERGRNSLQARKTAARGWSLRAKARLKAA